MGPVLFLFVLIWHPFPGLTPSANAVLASAIWMCIWWVGEFAPLAVTSLLPIFLLPVTNAASISQTTAAYGDKMLFLFMGGFMIAIGMEKWNLHKRIALNIIRFIGSKPKQIILGFMLATSLLSMWISNTATTLMMVTIGLAIISQTPGNDSRPFHQALLLGTAYSASIGGVGTLVGTPTNPIFTAIAARLFELEVSFADWMSFSMAFSLIMIFIAWYLLTSVFFKLKTTQLEDRDFIKRELKKLGIMTYEEKWMAIVFSIAAFAWITRSFLLNQFIPGLSDTSIAMGGAIFLFMIPAKSEKGMLLNWEEAVRLPWGVILLFGGGLSLAAAFSSSGLAEWIGMQMTGLQSFPLFGMILMVTLFVNFLTEIVSNVATTSIILPILATLAGAIGIHPFFLMIPATMAASCAFMMPIATGPNAIVFGSGQLKVADMAQAGFVLNLISSLFIAILTYFLLPSVFGI